MHPEKQSKTVEGVMCEVRKLASSVISIPYLFCDLER